MVQQAGKELASQVHVCHYPIPASFRGIRAKEESALQQSEALLNS